MSRKHTASVDQLSVNGEIEQRRTRILNRTLTGSDPHLDTHLDQCLEPYLENPAQFVCLDG